MAARTPPRKKAKKPRPTSNAEGILEFLREIGPQHELADAIQSVYEERHKTRSYGDRGKKKRRRSTRT